MAVAIVTALISLDMKEQIVRFAIVAIDDESLEFSTFIRLEQAKYCDVVKKAKVRIEYYYDALTMQRGLRHNPRCTGSLGQTTFRMSIQVMRKAIEAADEDSETTSSSPRQFVNGFARGLKVIRAFGEGAERLTLTQVASRAGLTRAGARRLLLTLQELGYASHIGRQYFLTPKVLSLGYAYISSMPLWNIAQPILGRLVRETNETCSISVLDDTDVVYILRIPVHRILSVGGNVGSRLPAYATSMGRVLLGQLSSQEISQLLEKVEMVPYTPTTTTDVNKLKKLIFQDYERGYSWFEGELEENISGLSVPIYNGKKKIIAALNISFNRPRITRDVAVRKYLSALKLAAEQMSRSMIMRDQRLPA